MFSQQVATPIMLTTKCRAGCSHCPFSSPEMVEFHLPLRQAEIAILQAPGKYVVLSGGEPLEYPNLMEAMRICNQAHLTFRLATGGHLPLSSIVDEFKSFEYFEGVSLGTDVLLGRANTKSVHQWLQNVHLLQQMRLDYSLTLTAQDKEDVDHLLQSLSGIAMNPNFIYLRYRQDIGDLNFVEMVQKLEKQFGAEVLAEAI